MYYKKPPDVIQKEIKRYFDDFKLRTINDLQLVDLCEEMYFYTKDIPQITEKYSLNDIMNFISYNYRKYLSKHHDKLTYFIRNIKRVRDSRRIAGAVVTSTDGSVLFVVNRNDELVLPMGKEGGKDFGNLKLTALRELGEETNIWLTKEEFMATRNYFDYKPLYGKEIRFFIVPGSFSKENVDLSHSRLGEIKKLMWVSQNELSSCFPSMKTLKTILSNGELKTTPRLNISEENAYNMYSQMQSNEKKRKEKKIRVLGKGNYSQKLKSFIMTNVC